MLGLPNSTSEECTDTLQTYGKCCDRVLMANYDLTASQAYSLLALEELGEVTMNELAREMRLHGTTMTRMLDSLVEKRLAQRKPDPGDRRVVRVSLSAQGQEMVQALQTCKRQYLAAAFDGLSDAEREAILHALQRLASTAEDLGARCCAC